MNYYYYTALVFPYLVPTIAEALCVMLIGVALWKWRVIQGDRSARFYLLLISVGLFGSLIGGLIVNIVPMLSSHGMSAMHASAGA